MAEFKTDYVKNLPDTYSKSTDSNNYKILNIIQGITTELNKDIDDVYKSLDIDQATGETLDLYGETVGQARGLADDIKYRVMIKSRIMRNFMNGDLNSIIESISLMFGCEKSDIKLSETNTPATVKVDSIPYNVINYIGLSVDQTLQLIATLIPVGVKIESIELSGTFEFSSTDSEYDESKGFSDSETNPTIGGYLGYLSSEENEKPLPIR